MFHYLKKKIESLKVKLTGNLLFQDESMECDADLVKASYVLAEKQFHKDMLYCHSVDLHASTVLCLALCLLVVIR